MSICTSNCISNATNECFSFISKMTLWFILFHLSLSTTLYKTFNNRKVMLVSLNSNKRFFFIRIKGTKVD